MTTPARQPLFDLGNITASAAAKNVLDASGEELAEFLDRHVQGDWGSLRDEGRQRNDQAVITGEQIVSEHRTGNGAKIRIVTEAVDAAGSRPATAILLPSEAAAPVKIEVDSSASDEPVMSLDGFVVL